MFKNTWETQLNLEIVFKHPNFSLNHRKKHFDSAKTVTSLLRLPFVDEIKLTGDVLLVTHRPPELRAISQTMGFPTITTKPLACAWFVRSYLHNWWNHVPTPKTFAHSGNEKRSRLFLETTKYDSGETYTCFNAATTYSYSYSTVLRPAQKTISFLHPQRANTASMKSSWFNERPWHVSL